MAKWSEIWKDKELTPAKKRAAIKTAANTPPSPKSRKNKASPAEAGKHPPHAKGTSKRILSKSASVAPEVEAEAESEAEAEAVVDVNEQR